MLARNTRGAQSIPDAEAVMTEWTSDGVKSLVGFSATGTWSAEFRLYVGADEDPWYVAQISPSNRNAYIADRGHQLPAGTKVVLKVASEAPEPQTYKGTILGS